MAVGRGSTVFLLTLLYSNSIGNWQHKSKKLWIKCQIKLSPKTTARQHPLGCLKWNKKKKSQKLLPYFWSLFVEIQFIILTKVYFVNTSYCIIHVFDRRNEIHQGRRGPIFMKQAHTSSYKSRTQNHKKAHTFKTVVKEMRKYFLPCWGPVLCFRAKFGDGLVQGNSKLIDSIIQVSCIYRRLKIEICI